MMRRAMILMLVGIASVRGAAAQAKFQGSDTHPVGVATSPDSDARAQPFRDSKFGVRFQVPPGWSLARKDGQFSTFHLDARTATPKTEMRGAASLGFNPFPQSVLSGATFYYSVEKHSTDAECSDQAAKPGQSVDTQNIGGMDFQHAHDEHGQMCVEARDEVYTAYRKGSCYRFDLETNTFCAKSSGAEELTDGQLTQVEQQMTDILSSVVLAWKKGGPHPVPVPALVKKPQTEPTPEPELKVHPHPPQTQAGQ